jgi:hypothetical protein
MGKTAIQKLTSKAGKASAAKLTPAQRTARARKAGLARGAKARARAKAAGKESR